MLLLLAVPLHAAVAGAPEPGPTGQLPFAAFATSNDMLANGVGNGDDFRTAAIGGHVRLGGAVLAIDGSMLTDRAARTRSDELLAVLGWTWGQQQPATGWHVGGFLGGGARIDGDLAGQAVQNAIHRQIGANEVFLPYDRERQVRDVRPAATASAVVGWLAPAGLGLTGWWGVQMLAAGQGALSGELIAEAGPRLVLIGQQGAFWAGTRFRLREGNPPGATVAATGAHEDGWWIDTGTFVTPFGGDDAAWGYQLRTSYNPHTHAAVGAIGVVVQPQGAPRGLELAVEHDLALYSGGGFGVQLRWYPWPYQDTGRRSAAVLDYRFGNEPDSALTFDRGNGGGPLGAELRHDQATLGWEEGYRSPDWSGLRFVPWVQAALGARQEGILTKGAGASETVAHAVAPVARGAAGIRLVVGERFSLGASLDGWLPAWSSEQRTAGSSITLNDPGWAIGLHAAAHLAW